MSLRPTITCLLFKYSKVKMKEFNTKYPIDNQNVFIYFKFNYLHQILKTSLPSYLTSNKSKTLLDVDTNWTKTYWNYHLQF